MPDERGRRKSERHKHGTVSCAECCWRSKGILYRRVLSICEEILERQGEDGMESEEDGVTSEEDGAETGENEVGAGEAEEIGV